MSCLILYLSSKMVRPIQFSTAHSLLVGEYKLSITPIGEETVEGFFLHRSELLSEFF
jgi:hypothetical protein